VQRATETRPYAIKIRELVQEVSAEAGDFESPLMSPPSESPKRVLLLVITSDRGLCGAYNTNVLRTGLAAIRKAEASGHTVDVEVAGKKGGGFFKFQGYKPLEQHQIGDKPSYEDVERIASSYIERFSDGDYDLIQIVSMRFESASKQYPEAMQLLPLAQLEADEENGSSGGIRADYDFSPSSEALLSELLPTSVKTSVFQAFVEGIVSEHIMRMVAMKAATENARDLGKDLRRSFNRARQSQITTELTEIISGAAALE
jgi:F-type H+-transporting ATPase subunit gamma